MSARTTALLLAAGIIAIVVLGIPASQTDRYPGDLAILEVVQRAAWFEPIAKFFHVLVDDWLISFFGVCLVVYLAYRGHQAAAVAVVVIWVTPLFTYAAKAIIDRPRPEGDFAILYVPDTAGHPSGHAANAALFATLVALAAFRLLPRNYAIATLAGCVVFAFVAGVSRVWLGVHWPSDVVYGWLFGVVAGGGAWAATHAIGAAIRKRGNER